MRPRRAHRQDGNHAMIRQAFLDAGCSWMDTYQLGAGRPDGVAALGGLCICIEIKDPSKSPSEQKLTPDEEKWHSKWTGGMRIVKDLQDVSDTVEVLKEWHRRIRDGLLSQPSTL